MTFPSTPELIKHYNFFLVSGPLVLTLSFFFWVRWIRSLSGSPQRAPLSGAQAKPTPTPTLLMFALATLLIGGVHFWGAYGSVANALKFQKLDASQITGMRIQRMTGEGQADSSAPMTINDPLLAREGWEKLADARSYMRNHEHFLGGYRIELLIGTPPTPSEYFLSAYSRSSRNPQADVVVPHIGTASQGTVNNAGEYRSPPFLEWVRKNVDPLFKKPS